ncbi:hypothetical protein ILUMI_04240 [Ignelater luminosus]|uniref:Uncharacterized protein n=1 Tax=Ignelater luminosus TaxID=2038154 RepID=A0A8K0DD79_IGNLU|nr:hypothetical protein ILUMI_04240 [Ignelater luminosus]
MRDLRKMAYETAVKKTLRMPDAWVVKEIAACSLSKATAFNKYNVSTFFDTLNTVMIRNPFGDGLRVFNLDETGLPRGPKEFIGYPKAKPRKENPNKRRRVVSCILTDTPQKKDLERREEEKKSKKIKKPKLDLDLPSSSSEESEPKMSDHESSGGEFCPSPPPPAMDLVLNTDPR